VSHYPIGCLQHNTEMLSTRRYPEIGHSNEHRSINFFLRLYSWLQHSWVYSGTHGICPTRWPSDPQLEQRRCASSLPWMMMHDDLSIMHGNKPVIILLRHSLHAFWCRLGQLFNKPACRSYARQPLECPHQIENKPGEPRNTARAGTTVFGGSTVLSSIFAQSLIMQNFPCKITDNVRAVVLPPRRYRGRERFERNAERTGRDVRMR
jgi:hypothetical protein